MTKNNTYEAYAIGYYHGRACGIEVNNYDDSSLRVLYTLGYERGVADYCEYDADKEANIDNKNTL